MESIQSVIQIGAQPVLGERLGNRPVSRSNRPEICLHRFCAAEWPIFTLLEDAQKPRLQISGHIGYFVEEQRPSACRRDHSGKIVRGSGERAFDVPEQFSLDHRLWERRTIELHHRLSSAPAASVNRVGDHFLANAAFAHDENIGIRRGHGFDQFLDFLHRLALKNWCGPRLRDLQALFELLCLLPQVFRLSKEEPFLQCFLHQAKQLFRCVRLADKMERAAFD